MKVLFAVSLGSLFYGLFFVAFSVVGIWLTGYPEYLSLMISPVFIFVGIFGLLICFNHYLIKKDRSKPPNNSDHKLA
jgi:hypothetical protein